MAAATFGELNPQAQTKVYDLMADVTSVSMRTAGSLSSADTDLDEMLYRVGRMRAMLDNARSEIVAARGV